MSGHSKWSTIKRKKGKEDAKRGQIFTKIVKEITVAARLGGGSIEGNPRLRFLVDKARTANMPQENIMRAIKKGTGELPGVHYEAYTYEGYGPHGIAVILDVLTDNKNRTAAEMRRLFSSKSGNLGETGSVNWMFQQKGVIRLTHATITEEALLELLIDYNIDDINKDEDAITITCEAKSLDAIKKVLTAAGYTLESAEIEWVAKDLVELPEVQQTKVYEFLEELEEHDDVQHVYSNVA